MKAATCFLQSRAPFPKGPSPPGLPGTLPSWEGGREVVLLGMAMVQHAPWLLDGCLVLTAEQGMFPP